MKYVKAFLIQFSFVFLYTLMFLYLSFNVMDRLRGGDVLDRIAWGIAVASLFMAFLVVFFFIQDLIKRYEK